MPVNGLKFKKFSVMKSYCCFALKAFRLEAGFFMHVQLHICFRRRFTTARLTDWCECLTITKVGNSNLTLRR